MAQPCRACTHPDRDAIDAALAAGTSCRAVARTHGLDPTSVSRHNRAHRGASTASTATPLAIATPQAPQPAGTATPTATPLALQGVRHTQAVREHWLNAGTSQAQKAFLAAFEKAGNVMSAARASGVERRSHYDWLEQDTDYAERFKQAQLAFGDQIHRKFTSAILEAEPHDVLLHPVAAIAELKRWFPESYRDNQQINVNVDARTAVGDWQAAVAAARDLQEQPA